MTHARHTARDRYARCSCDAGAYQFDQQQLGRKSVREHQRLGAAVAAAGEQFERAAVVGISLARAAARIATISLSGGTL